MSRKVQLSILVVGIIFIILRLILSNDVTQLVKLDSPSAITYNIELNNVDFTLEDIYELNGNNVNISYQSNSNIPKQIVGKFSKNNIHSQEDALSVLLGLRNIFQINEYDFYCNSIDERKDINVYLLHQLHNGVPVDGGYFRIVTSKEGETISIEGIFKDVSNIETIPKVSCEEGYKILNISSSVKVISVELVVCTLSNIDSLLCWKYITENTDPTNDKIVYVSAIDGNIVLEISAVND